MQPISTLDKSLASGGLNRKDLGAAQRKIMEFVKESQYAHWFPKIIGAFYDFTIAQLFKIKFYYDFESQGIECQIDKERLSNDEDATRNAAIIDERIQELLQKYPFIILDPIKENHGQYFYARESIEEVQLSSQENVNKLLLEVVQTALEAINSQRELRRPIVTNMTPNP